MRCYLPFPTRAYYHKQPSAGAGRLNFGANETQIRKYAMVFVGNRNFGKKRIGQNEDSG
jgi:hypothetical protein